MARTGSNGRPALGYEHGKRWKAFAAATDPRSMAAWVRRYLEALLALKFAPSTAHKRCQDLSYFVEWCELRSLTTPPDLTRPILERYQRHLADYRKVDGKPLSVNTQVSTIQSLQGFFRWLAQGNHILYNPAADLTMPRVPQRRLPEPLTIEEIERAFATLDPYDPVELRDRAMWEVLYSTGMRRAEIIKLYVADVDRGRGTVFVRQGKGGKDRVVPIGERALAWLEKYLIEVRDQWAPDPQRPHLFVNPNGQPLTPATLTHRVRAMLDGAGITKAGSCHLFRHTMATQMLEHGADVRYVQEMLGHAHLNTTQIYTHVSIGRLKAIHSATHPAAKLARKIDPQDRDDSAGGG